MIQRVPPFKVSIEDAQALGVHPGTFEESAVTLWHLDAPWCAPLVMPGPVEVFDFTEGYDANRKLKHLFGIGRYAEDRKNMYNSDLFQAGAEARRTIHMGIDIGAAEGTPIFSPVESVVWGTAILSADGDYGGTVILKWTSPNGASLFMPFGHLSHATVHRLKVGQALAKGELLGWLGGKTENGGWNPHLHWQLSRLEPLKVDLPGAVAPSQLAVARRIFPDPTDIFKLALAGWSDSYDS